MKGWSRINDFGMQTFGYVKDDAAANDLMRLVHAFNHLCYMATAGQLETEEDWHSLVERQLLSPSEVTWLRSQGGSASNQCIYAAAAVICRAAEAGHVHTTLVLGLDRSLCECRQNTTLLPLIVETPVPWPYYHAVIWMEQIWLVLAALEYAGTAQATEYQWETQIVAMLIYILVASVYSAIKRTAFMLSEPFGQDAIDLPAEEFVLRPLLGHQGLFKSRLSSSAAKREPTCVFAENVPGIVNFTAHFDVLEAPGGPTQTQQLQAACKKRHRRVIPTQAPANCAQVHPSSDP